MAVTTTADVGVDIPVDVAPPTSSRPHWIDDWRPEDATFWAEQGEAIARRNLIWSIISEHIGFAIWSLWSVFVLFLGPEYGFDPGQKFLLTTLPTAVGGVLRLPYTFATARFGGRNWTIFSAGILVVPCLLAAFALHPGVSFTTLLLCAAVAGVGGGNFSSSMANIDAFYPQRLKGWALGLNAGGGNLGVAGVQLVGLAVLATAGVTHPRLILAVYLPLIVVAVAGAALKMDNLSGVANEKGAMRDVAKHRHTWIIALLYIGTFGSFIGFGFAFGQVVKAQFYADLDPGLAARKAAYLTFLGPLLGSLVRPYGGKLADKVGGAKVSLVTFVAMAGGAGLVLAASKADSAPLFIVAFIVLFVLTGIGNGSVYKMIPAIFDKERRADLDAGGDEGRGWATARKRSRALIGIAGSIGALGGVAVNLAFRQSFNSTGNGNGAYVSFIAFYALCAMVTWLVYVRRSAPMTGV